MIVVKNSEFSQLVGFHNMDMQSHVKDHLKIKSLGTHQNEFKNTNIIYLSVFNEKNLAGYIILEKEKPENSIQLKRKNRKKQEKTGAVLTFQQLYCSLIIGKAFENRIFRCAVSYIFARRGDRHEDIY